MRLVPAYILIAFILLGQNAIGQNRKLIDSLTFIMATTAPDTVHVDSYLELYYQYHRVSLDTAMDYARKAKSLSQELNFTKGFIKATYRLGTGYRFLRDFEMAEKELLQSLKLSDSLSQTVDMASAYSGLARVYYEKNEFDQAATNYLKALALLEKTEDRNSEARILNELGNLCKKQRQNDKALGYFEDALRIVRKLDFQPGISACLLNIGTVYLDMRDYNRALPYFNESFAIKKKTGDKVGQTRCLINLGNANRGLKKYELAREQYLAGLALAKEVVNPIDITDALYNLAQNEFQRGHFDASLSYAEESLAQVKLTNDLETSIEICRLISDTYAAMNQSAKAYEYARMINVLSDSLYDEKMIKVSTELDAKYQREKKEKEIADLNNANGLSALQLQKRITERNYLIGLTLLLVLLGLVVWSRYRIKLKSNQKLKELDQIKSRFFANISHEFRTPLTLISGCLEDLSNSVDRKEDKERLTIMQNNTLQLRQLIEQLLDLSKLENNKLKLSVEPVNPKGFLNAISSSFSSWASQKNITLKVDLPSLDVVAYIDPDVLEKIINNLLSNAIKFTPPGGNVLLSATWTDEEMVIVVRDDGPGIPSSKLSQIFERFYQVDNSNTRNHQGSGIGLALVKELVSLHQGIVSVESQPNEGTTFKVIIPIRESNYETSGVATTTRERQFRNNFASTSFREYDDSIERTGENSVVLVVEDNIDLGHFIRDHLPHCDIILASNGKEGHYKAIQYVPDLIISDVMMPEMDGVELCKRVKEDEKTSHIPVILLTAKADIESRLQGLETGADDYMTKPFDNRELQTRVRNLIEQRKKLRSHFSKTMILKPKDIAITAPDEVFLSKVMVVIEAHMSDSEFSMDDFQKEMGMSRMQLHRKLKALTGHSAGEFLRIQRLIRASDMLSKTNLNISEVCYQTGFTSLSYFAKCFKKQFGTGPKDFAALHSQEH